MQTILRSHSNGLRTFFLTISFVWVAFFIVVIFVEYRDAEKLIESMAYAQANAAIEKDFAFRRWAASHGGFYAIVEKDVKPNEYLAKIPERNVELKSGRKLTLLNPAYMIRLQYESNLLNKDLSGKIVSLHPINPKNIPDEWEKYALQSFENGKSEKSDFYEKNGKTFFRLMKPFKSEESCFKCHEKKPLENYVHRGGVSISIPVEKLKIEAYHAMMHSILVYIFVLFFGGILFVYGFIKFKNKIKEKEEAEEHIVKISQYLASASEGNFFGTLAKYLSESLNMEYAIISEISSDHKKATTLAIYANDKLSDNICYLLEGTPCENVVKDSICAYTESVGKLFPKDTMLLEINAESYVGSVLLDEDGNPAGIICVLSKNPLKKSAYIESVLKIFAVRASAELIRMKTKNELLESESRLQAVQKVAKMGNWELDLVTNELKWSDGIFEMFEIDKEKHGVSYEIFLSRIPEYDRIKVDKAYTESVKNKTSYEIGHEIIMPDGRVKHVYEIGKTFYDDLGNAIKSIGSIQDVSDHKRLENEMIKSQKNDSLGLLAGGIAHDFNNILTAILGNASLAHMRITNDPEVDKLLNNVEIASNKATAIARQLLMFAKRGEPLKRVVNVRSIISNSISLGLSGSNVTDEVIFKPNLWNIDADGNQIEQVFTNLLINATHAMPEGGKVCIVAENTELDIYNPYNLPEGEYVKISVQDEGHGIPPENLQKIFDPYFTTKEKGSGLGLATSYTILRNHNGNIFVESQIGKGTTFHVLIPASRLYANVEEIEEPLIKTKISKKVLIMDDDDLVIGIIENIFETMGFIVTVSRDGKEAIQKYKIALETKNYFDLVVMDLTVPGGMGGKEAISHILSLDPKAKVMVSSGYSSDPIMEKFNEYGFIASMPKPYRYNDVVKKMKELFG